MPSFVWERDPAEAYLEPYEYGGQEQFAREAASLVVQLKAIYKESGHTYKLDDQTASRAVWMLQVDALSALSDTIDLLAEKRFRVASSLFRNVVETLDASYYFALAGKSASGNLKKWYANEVISHRIYRDFVKRHKGSESAEELRCLYSDLSKYTHRTYRALNMGYLLGRENAVFYDAFLSDDNSYVLPQVISFSYAVIAGLMKRFVQFAVDTRQITKIQEITIWDACLEKDSVERRFGRAPGQLRRGPPIPLDEC